MDSAVIVITVAIVAQELTFADALAIRLDAEDDIKVVAVAKPSSGAVLRLRADVILLDADLGRDAANLLCDADSSLVNRVVMLSQTSEPERIVEAVQAGAAAWIRKDESLEHLLEVLRGAARGQIWLPVAETGKVPPLLGHQHNDTSDDELARPAHPARASGPRLPGRRSRAERSGGAPIYICQYRANPPAEHHDEARRPFDP